MSVPNINYARVVTIDIYNYINIFIVTNCCRQFVCGTGFLPFNSSKSYIHEFGDKSVVHESESVDQLFVQVL